MIFDDYQRRARETAIYPRVGNNYVYPIMGLCGEAGELANKIKKLMRDYNCSGINELKNMMEHPEGLKMKEAVRAELGDVLWYVSAVASEFGLKLNDVAVANLEKLFNRKAVGTLRGDGDNR